MSELNKQSVTQWQNEWDRTTKGATTKSFFPKITDRLKMRISVTPNYTTLITGHGNIKTYLYKYKILDTPMCSCKGGDQTVDHKLFDCKLLENERNRQRAAVSRSENWPERKKKLSVEFYKILKNLQTKYASMNYREEI